jgi:hypothetical protein
MNVAADNALDLRIARHDVAKRARIVKADLVHVCDPGAKWRMMHEDQRGLFRRLAQAGIEPSQSLVAQRAPTLPRDHRIQSD